MTDNEFAAHDDSELRFFTPLRMTDNALAARDDSELRFFTPLRMTDNEFAARDDSELLDALEAYSPSAVEDG